MARARALLRRVRTLSDGAAASTESVPPAADGVVRVRGIEIDLARRRVLVEGREVELTDQLGRSAVDQIKQHARQVLVPWADATLDVQPVAGLEAARDAWTRIAHGGLGVLGATTGTP